MKRILVLSDLHVGSMFAVLPPKAIVTEGDKPIEAPLNDAQQYLWKCWKHMVANVGKLDMVLVNGDQIDGSAPKDLGQFLSLRKISDQIAACVALLQPLREAAKTLWMVKGTPYHGMDASQDVENLAEVLDADRWPTGLRTGTEFWHEIGGKIIHASHHMTRFMYAAGGAERTALLNLANEALGKTPRADILVRSHLHVRRIVSLHGKTVIMTPAWKLVNPWAAKVMESTRAEFLSDLGAVLVEIGPNGVVHVDDTSFAYPNYQITVGRD